MGELSKALVTGAGGFVAGELCRRLAQSQWPFVGVVRPGAPRPKSGTIPWPAESFIEMDLSQPDAGRRIVDLVRPAVIFNLAAVGVRRGSVRVSIEQFIAINVWLAAALGEHMSPNCVLVQVGSMSQYKSAPGTLNEDSAERDRSTLYAWSKNAADEILALMAAEEQKRCVRVRLFGIVGTGEARDRLLPSIVIGSRLERPIHISDGQQVRDVLHVSDVADALVHVSSAPSLFGLGVNVGRGEGWTVRQIAEATASELGCMDRLQFGGQSRRPGEGDRYVADVNRLASTGWTPHYDVHESIRRATSELVREYPS